MKKSIKQIMGIAFAGILSASASFAAPIYTTFGPLPDATFGGSGIPNGAVAISTYNDLTLGLTATPRYSSPAVSNNGAGTFYAGVGSQWNFDFYVNNTGSELYTYSLEYGLAGGTASSFNPLSILDNGSVSGTQGGQNSENLIWFLPGYDINADATYDFLLTAKNDAGGVVAQSGIQVVVGRGSSVPDGGSTIALLGVAFAGIAGLRRKFLA